MAKTITKKDLQARFNKAMKLNGYSKVNIIHEDGMNEGVWAVCCTKKDKAIYDGDTDGDTFNVYLANHALIGGPSWGLKFKVTSSGLNRPTINVVALLAQIKMQPVPRSYAKDLTNILGG